MRLEPMIRIDSAFFWEACNNEELVCQKCEACNLLWHPPRPLCPQCHSTHKTIEKLSGRGKVLSWAQSIHPPAFGFEQPPITILVELQEGIRFVSTIENIDIEDITVGLEVMVAFTETSGDKKIPIFKPCARK